MLVLVHNCLAPTRNGWEFAKAASTGIVCFYSEMNRSCEMIKYLCQHLDGHYDERYDERFEMLDGVGLNNRSGVKKKDL